MSELVITKMKCLNPNCRKSYYPRVQRPLKCPDCGQRFFYKQVTEKEKKGGIHEI